jgi:hypothetical protein
MRLKTKMVQLISIMVLAICAVEAITIGVLYHTALGEEKKRLETTAKSQARLMEAIAKFDSAHYGTYPGGSIQATLIQILDAHENYETFGRTGEFVLGYLKNNEIKFIFSHNKRRVNTPGPITVHPGMKYGEPIRLALAGRSGTVIGLDYNGKKVLAAYEPVRILGMGIVAKIDMSEIRAPFIRAGLLSILMGSIFAIAGSYVFIRIMAPVLVRLETNVRELEDAMNKVKQLNGLLPICASCKKIRDDSGYWEQIETYIRNHSDAEFSHGICPDCAKKLYSEFKK